MNKTSKHCGAAPQNTRYVRRDQLTENHKLLLVALNTKQSAVVSEALLLISPPFLSHSAGYNRGASILSLIQTQMVFIVVNWIFDSLGPSLFFGVFTPSLLKQLQEDTPLCTLLIQRPVLPALNYLCEGLCLSLLYCGVSTQGQPSHVPTSSVPCRPQLSHTGSESTLGCL